MRRARYAGIGAVVVATCGLLSSCAASFNDNVPMPIPTHTVSTSPSASPVAQPDPDPTLLPGGTALANFDYFNFVNKRLLAVNPNPSSEAIVENLINSGFSKDSLEVTADHTAVIRRAADSIEFSVRTSNGCLLGEFAAGGYTSMVGPLVNGTSCLIGETEPIK